MAKSVARNLCWVLAIMLVLSSYGVMSQEKPAAGEGGAAAPAAQGGERPRTRLPAYFAAVVNAKQRQEIATVQEEYGQKIEALQKQLDELMAERDKAVDGVLTEEQLAEVNKRREAAREARTARARAPAGEAPPASDPE